DGPRAPAAPAQAAAAAPGPRPPAQPGPAQPGPARLLARPGRTFHDRCTFGTALAIPNRHRSWSAGALAAGRRDHDRFTAAPRGESVTITGCAAPAAQGRGNGGERWRRGAVAHGAVAGRAVAMVVWSCPPGPASNPIRSRNWGG